MGKLARDVTQSFQQSRPHFLPSSSISISTIDKQPQTFANGAKGWATRLSAEWLLPAAWQAGSKKDLGMAPESVPA
jgi:hypothetical protein